MTITSGILIGYFAFSDRASEPNQITEAQIEKTQIVNGHQRTPAAAMSRKKIAF